MTLFIGIDVYTLPKKKKLGKFVICIIAYIWDFYSKQ